MGPLDLQVEILGEDPDLVDRGWEDIEEASLQTYSDIATVLTGAEELVEGFPDTVLSAGAGTYRVRAYAVGRDLVVDEVVESCSGTGRAGSSVMTAPDVNTMAMRCQTVSDALDSSVILLGAQLEKYRNLDPSAVHLFRNGAGPLDVKATTEALLHIGDELDFVLSALQLANDRLAALLPYTSQIYPPAP